MPPLNTSAEHIIGLLQSKMPMQREAGVKLLAEVAKSATLRKRADIAALLGTVNGRDTKLQSGKLVPVQYDENQTAIRTALRTTLNSVRSDTALSVQSALKQARERTDAENRKNDAQRIE